MGPVGKDHAESRIPGTGTQEATNGGARLIIETVKG